MKRTGGEATFIGSLYIGRNIDAGILLSQQNMSDDVVSLLQLVVYDVYRKPYLVKCRN